MLAAVWSIACRATWLAASSIEFPPNGGRGFRRGGGMSGAGAIFLMRLVLARLVTRFFLRRVAALFLVRLRDFMLPPRAHSKRALPTSKLH